MKRLTDLIILLGVLSFCFGIIAKFAWPNDNRFAFVSLVLSAGSFLAATYLRTRAMGEDLRKSVTEIERGVRRLSSDLLPCYELRRYLSEHFSLLTRLRDAGKSLQDIASEELFAKYLHLRFDDDIDRKLRECVEQLDRRELTLTGPDIQGFREFIRLFWESAPDRAVIRSSSIVDPSYFWLNAEAYVQSQSELIAQQRVAIYRYFVIAGNGPGTLAEHRDALIRNIRAGIRTRVTLFRDVEQARALGYWRDVGLIENTMVAENTTDERNFITKVSCVLRSPSNERRLREASDLFTNLERFANTFRSEDHHNDPDKFVEAVQQRYQEILAQTP